VVIKTNRSDKTEIKKFFLKISGPQQVAPAPYRGHPHTPSLLVVADLVHHLINTITYKKLTAEHAEDAEK
jgi:hypothetical protein